MIHAQSVPDMRPEACIICYAKIVKGAWSYQNSLSDPPINGCIGALVIPHQSMSVEVVR
jgi:hypothetical protein